MNSEQNLSERLREMLVHVRTLDSFEAVGAVSADGTIAAKVEDDVHAVLRLCHELDDDRRETIHKLELTTLELASREQYLQSIYANIDAAIFVIDVDAGGSLKFVGLNPAHERLTGLSTALVRGKAPEGFLDADTARAVRGNYERCLAAGATIEYEENLVFDGKETWWNTRLIPVKDKNGRITSIIGASNPITQLRQAEKIAREETLFVKSLLQVLPFPVFYADNHLNMLGYNEMFRRFFGITGDLIGLPELGGMLKPEDFMTFQREARILSGAGRNSGTKKMVAVIAKISRTVELHLTSYTDDSGTSLGVVGLIVDITERLQTEERLQELAIMDELTGLLNRRGFNQLAAREWRKVCRLEGQVSLIMLDIDYFKHYNDHYGHPAGDLVLRQVAAEIQKAVLRPADLTARYGGEEFVIVLPGTEKPGAQIVVARILERVRALAIEHAKSDVFGIVTVSAGLATAGLGHDNAGGIHSLDELVAAADKNLYQAKNTGRNKFISEP